MKKQQVVRELRKIVVLIACLMLLFQLASCGTILYPERRGQKPELARLDVAVVVLDGALLLLFVVPGVIAYAVDFATGCIYLPARQLTLTPNGEGRDLQVIQVDPNTLDIETINRLVQEHTGYVINIDSPDLHVFRPDNQDIDIRRELNRLNAGLAPVAEGTWFTEVIFVDDARGWIVKFEAAAPMNTCSVTQ